MVDPQGWKRFKVTGSCFLLGTAVLTSLRTGVPHAPASLLGITPPSSPSAQGSEGLELTLGERAWGKREDIMIQKTLGIYSGTFFSNIKLRKNISANALVGRCNLSLDMGKLCHPVVIPCNDNFKPQLRGVYYSQGLQGCQRVQTLSSNTCP